MRNLQKAVFAALMGVEVVRDGSELVGIRFATWGGLELGSQVRSCSKLLTQFWLFSRSSDRSTTAQLFPVSRRTIHSVIH